MNFTGFWSVKPGNDIESVVFPTVGTDKPDNLRAAHLEVYFREGQKSAETLDDARSLQHVGDFIC